MIKLVFSDTFIFQSIDGACHQARLIQTFFKLINISLCKYIFTKIVVINSIQIVLEHFLIFLNCNLSVVFHLRRYRLQIAGIRRLIRLNNLIMKCQFWIEISTLLTLMRRLPNMLFARCFVQVDVESFSWAVGLVSCRFPGLNSTILTSSWT